MQIPKYGDEIILDVGNGDIRATVVFIDEHEMEYSEDGGDTTEFVWLDDLSRCIVVREA